MGPNNPIAWIDEDEARRWLGVEQFRRAPLDSRPAIRCSSISAKSPMLIDTLDVLRCPYCGGRLSLVDSLFHRRTADEIHDGILGCHCCIFPLVDGIPVLHLLPAATAARDQVQAGRPDLARRAMFGLDDDGEAEAFDAVGVVRHGDLSRHGRGARAELRGRLLSLSLLRPDLRRRPGGGRARSARRRASAAARRAIDICGGSGHVTRTLLDLSSTPPVLADLYFAKVWLARRFTAPGCEPVCCDGNAPMPFARGAFSFAMCTDAFMYIWTKRQFVGEMERLVDAAATSAGAVLIGHTHNERTWSPSHGQPLSPEGYADLFETIEPRLFGEADLFEDVVAGGPLDLSRRDDQATLDASPALTIIASRHPRRVRAPSAASSRRSTGELRINPLYTPAGGGRASAPALGVPRRRIRARNTAPAGSICRRS